MTTCPQCESHNCPPVACRFSGITNARHRELQQQNAGAARIDKRPKWVRDVATGARDSYAPSGYWNK